MIMEQMVTAKWLNFIVHPSFLPNVTMALFSLYLKVNDTTP